MNKEEKSSHVLPFRIWVVYFSPFCRATPQGIREKYGKFRVIFDLLTQTSPNKVVLNHQTSMDCKAIIDFGRAKTNLFINIYNWQVSYSKEIIHLALANITACFRFPRIFGRRDRCLWIRSQKALLCFNKPCIWFKHLGKLMGSPLAGD